MTEEITTAPHTHHEPHGGHAPAALPFNEAAWQEFRQSDIGAAKVIVLLMAGIFLTGLALYTLVAIVAAS
jgi:hypothetical protein